VRFGVKHNGISIVDGQFKSLRGSVVSKTAEDFEEAVFNYTIQVNSIDTRVDARDTHLLSDDFFAVEEYPQITLKNAKLQKKEGNRYVLKGNLTMKDVTKPVTFDVVYNGKMTDSRGFVHVGFTATTVIDRTDFNINYNGKLPSGVPAVAKDIKIVVNTELMKSENDAETDS